MAHVDSAGKLAFCFSLTNLSSIYDHFELCAVMTLKVKFCLSISQIAFDRLLPVPGSNLLQFVNPRSRAFTVTDFSKKGNLNVTLRGSDRSLLQLRAEMN